MTDDPRLGLTVTHRRYVPYAHAHYAGDLVDGAYTLGLFGDVATELAIRADGDEGLLAGYSEVRFLGPVRAGDVLEATCEVVRVGRRSRELRCTARARRADAVLVSQVVTQKDAHLRNTRELAGAFREAMGSSRPLLVVGGPRFDPAMAAELGVDKVFGRGTTPGEVASYLVHALVPQEKSE